MAGKPATNTRNPTISSTTTTTTTAAAPTVSGQYTDLLHSLIVLNIEGILPSTFKAKLQLLSELAQEEKALIISLTESHLSENIKEAEIKIQNYTPFRTDRYQRKKGGVVSYIHDSIAAPTEILLSESNSYTEAQVLYIKDVNLILINIYRPQACPAQKFIEPLNKIQAILHNLPPPMPNIMLTGDLNLPLMNWESESVYGGTAEMRLQATALLNFATDFCLSQHIDKPTRGNNILDLVMSNNDDLIHEYSVEKTVLSDHNIINIKTTMNKSGHNNVSSLAPHTELNFNQLNFFSESVSWEDIKTDLGEVDWCSLMKHSDPEHHYETLVSTCLQISRKHVPPRRTAKKSSIPRDRKILMRKRSKLQKRLRNRTHDAPTHVLEHKIAQIEEKLKMSVETELERSETLAVSRIKSNSKYFYKYARTKSKVKTGVGPLKDAQGHIKNEPREIAEVLKMQYEQVFSTPTNENIIDTPSNFFTQESETESSIVDINITEKCIEEAIKDIANNAAAGPDQFPAILLRKCSKELSTPLKLLYRTSLDSGIIPRELKRAKITPVYKGGSRSEAKNYRPIALTSHIIKILEKILVKHITSFLEDNRKLNQDQYGFRAGRSCLAQLLAHHEKILAALEHDKNVDVIYLDFAKAYDKVDHGILLRKVRDMGIVGKLGVWLHSFLTDREQSVSVGGVVAQPSIVISGVPQGSVLGPLLFIIHIADINKDVKHSSVASFADDTRVLREISSENEATELQSDLSVLYRWADENNMSFNNNKFEHMMYATNSFNARYQYVAQDGSNIETRECIRDLGITLSCDGTFSVHITNTAKKARNQAGWILRTFRTRETFPMLTLFKSLVLPLLEYCCQLWSPWKVGEKQALEAIQRSYTSKITSVKHLDYWKRLQALELYSLERRRERYAIIYIYKVISGQITNNIDISTRTHTRLGRLCHVGRAHPRAATRVKSLKENAFATRGPLLFNALPRQLRDLNTSPEQFKTQLDKFLWTIPDQPKLPHYTLRAASNSIIHQLAQQRADGNFNGGASAWPWAE